MRGQLPSEARYLHFGLSLCSSQCYVGEQWMALARLNILCICAVLSESSLH